MIYQATTLKVLPERVGPPAAKITVGERRFTFHPVLPAQPMFIPAYRVPA